MTIKLTEFHKHPTGSIMYHRMDGDNRILEQGDRAIIVAILEKIKNEFPDTYSCLADIYKDSKLNRVFFEYQIVFHFISCNFAEFDLLDFDIDENGDFCFEEVRCPLRGGLCPHEGIICKPIPVKLTSREVQVLSLMAQGHQAKTIALILEIAIDTVNNHRRSILEKINVNSSTGAILYYNKYLKL